MEPLQTFEDAAKLGDVVRLRLLWPKPFFLVKHPDDYERIVDTRLEIYPKGYLVLPYETAFGPTLVSRDDAENAVRRKVQQPCYRRSFMVGFDDRVVREVQTMLASWEKIPAGEFFDLRSQVVTLQLRIMGSLLFSHNFEGETETITTTWEAMMRDLIQVAIHEHTPILRQYSSRARRRFARSRRVFIRILAKIVADRRAGITKENDMLTALLEGRDANGRPWSDHVILSEMLGMIGAGFEATASTMLWTFYRLAKHPEAEGKLHEELDGLPDPIDWSAVMKAPYLKWTIDEILRLHPAIHLITRISTEEDTLSGFRIPAGSIVGMLPFVTQQDERWWSDPTRFWPERFDPANFASRPKYAFFAFGGGARNCIGAAMAKMLLPLVIGNISRNYRLILPEGFSTTSRNAGWPRDSIQVRLERRG